MLWVGAGWGLPEEFITDKPVLPFKGHAIEARIYAEDPLRGYLPSTGSLLPYVEPPSTFSGTTTLDEEYCRMDSGVADGHVVTPFYDPMLSKTVYYAPDRARAIEGLATALDQYVIEGVQHNARLVNGVLRNADFMAGKTPTSFLDTHYPDGFHGVELTPTQEEELAVASAMIQSHKHSLEASESVMVQLGGMFGKAFRVAIQGNTATVQFISKNPDESDGPARAVSIDAVDDSGSTLDYQPRKYLAKVNLDGKPRFVQVRSWLAN
jgi:propionyl-CoA carboxylase alpha chain